MSIAAYTTINDVNYLLDLFKEIKQGVDEGVLYEIESAEEMLEGIKKEIISSMGDNSLDQYYNENLSCER